MKSENLAIVGLQQYVRAGLYWNPFEASNFSTLRSKIFSEYKT